MALGATPALNSPLGGAGTALYESGGLILASGRLSENISIGAGEEAGLGCVCSPKPDQAGGGGMDGMANEKLSEGL